MPDRGRPHSHIPDCFVPADHAPADELAAMIDLDPRMEDLKDSLQRVAAGAEDAVPGQAGPAAAAAFMFGLHVGLEFASKHPADAASMAGLIATMDAVVGTDPITVSAYYVGLRRE